MCLFSFFLNMYSKTCKKGKNFKVFRMLLQCNVSVYITITENIEKDSFESRLS